MLYGVEILILGRTLTSYWYLVMAGSRVYLVLKLKCYILTACYILHCEFKVIKYKTKHNNSNINFYFNVG